MVRMTNYQWSIHHGALDPKLEDRNLIGSPWRVPRAMPGLAYEKSTNKKGKVVQKELVSYKVEDVEAASNVEENVEAAGNVEEKKAPQEDGTAATRDEDYAATGVGRQGYNTPDEGLDNDDIDEITEDGEESDEDYYDPPFGSSEPLAKNGQRKFLLPDLNKSPKVKSKRFKSIRSL